MTKEDRETILMVVDNEIEALDRDLARRPPQMDDEGRELGDIRRHWLARLLRSRKAMAGVKIEK